MRVELAAFGAAIAAATLAPGASAYRLDHHVVPQPKLLYYVALKDWKKPFDRAVRDINRHHVGVTLKKAKIPEQAPIQVGRLEHECGLPGVDGTTHTIRGGYAAIYLPRHCPNQTIASIIVAHELGHALGLRHDDRHCALLNSSGSGPNGIPTQCGRRHFDWLHHPYRKDDLKGLRRLYRDTAPKASLTRDATRGLSVRVKVRASDRERNISELHLDWGDGTTPDEADAGTALRTTHTYAKPGTYTIKLTVLDFYLKKGRAKITLTVR
jgi:PKD domain